MAFHTKKEQSSEQNKPYPQQPIPSIKEKKKESREIFCIRWHIQTAEVIKQRISAQQRRFQARGNEPQAARQATILFSLTRHQEENGRFVSKNANDASPARRKDNDKPTQGRQEQLWQRLTERYP